MENFSYSSCPDSGDSSPLSREIDADNQSWEEPPSAAAYKVKFMCSYGGKIQPRPHDNQLAYIGGDTKILSVDRNIKFSTIMAKLSSLCSADGDICFKYQLPGEDLDALISVTNDEDLEHMMLEYDRLCRASAKPARLRLFLFPLNPPPTSAAGAVFSGGEGNTERQWFVDVLNSVQMQNLEGSSPPTVTAAGNPDFLFGLDKVKAQDLVAVAPVAPTVPEVVAKDITASSDCGSDDRFIIGEQVSPAEIQRQIQELQRLQIAANQERGVLRRNNDESLPPRAFTQDYYKIQEKIVPAPAPGSAPVQVPVPASYFPMREVPSGYPVTAAPPPGIDQPVYFIPSSVPGVYPPQAAMRPGTGPTGQQYYGVQRVVQEMYREQPQYNAVPVTGSMQQGKAGGYSEGISMVQARATVDPQYVQVGYDGAGRQVYYTTPYPVAAAAASGGGGGALNQDVTADPSEQAPLQRVQPPHTPQELR